jgi:hypothetical protein
MPRDRIPSIFHIPYHIPYKDGTDEDNVSELKPQDRLGFLEQQFKRKPAWRTTARRGSAAQAWTCGHRPGRCHSRRDRRV